MMRVCQKDTCPVGVATQNPELRERFTGKPEYIITFFTLIAEQVREILASLGLRSIDEAVGRVDLLDAREAIDHWKASGLDLTPIQRIEPRPGSSLHCVRPQEHGLDSVLWTSASSSSRAPPSKADRRCRSPLRSPTPTARPEPCSGTKSPCATETTDSRRTRSTSN